MYAQVALECLQVSEAGATGVAGVGLLPRVDEHVGPQVSYLMGEGGEREREGEGRYNFTVQMIRL